MAIIFEAQIVAFHRIVEYEHLGVTMCVTWMKKVIHSRTQGRSPASGHCHEERLAGHMLAKRIAVGFEFVLDSMLFSGGAEP